MTDYIEKRIADLEFKIRALERINVDQSVLIDKLQRKIARKQKRFVPPDIRLAVRGRSGGRCEDCGLEADHIHHIDKNRENNSLENLKHLCVGCHSREHQRRIPALF